MCIQIGRGVQTKKSHLQKKHLELQKAIYYEFLNTSYLRNNLHEIAGVCSYTYFHMTLTVDSEAIQS